MGIIFWKEKAIGCHWPISDLEEFGSLWVMWLKECWSEVIWLKTPPITYPKASVSIQIWHSGSKCLRIKASVKAFYRCMKASLALGVRKSVPELAFTKFGFLDLANFTTDNRFLISLLTPTLPPALAGLYWFFLFSIVWVFKIPSSVIRSIDISRTVILLKFWMNLL